jgi:hypothetical protein
MLEELGKSGVTQGIPIDELNEQVQEGEGVFFPMALRVQVENNINNRS